MLKYCLDELRLESIKTYGGVQEKLHSFSPCYPSTQCTEGWKSRTTSDLDTFVGKNKFQHICRESKPVLPVCSQQLTWPSICS